MDSSQHNKVGLANNSQPKVPSASKLDRQEGSSDKQEEPNRVKQEAYSDSNHSKEVKLEECSEPRDKQGQPLVSLQANSKDCLARPNKGPSNRRAQEDCSILSHQPPSSSMAAREQVFSVRLREVQVELSDQTLKEQPPAQASEEPLGECPPVRDSQPRFKPRQFNQ